MPYFKNTEKYTVKLRIDAFKKHEDDLSLFFKNNRIEKSNK